MDVVTVMTRNLVMSLYHKCMMSHYSFFIRVIHLPHDLSHYISGR